MDFGIARSVELDTATGTIIGTPAYMSPEQAEGKPADARSDIYALGLIFYEMFSGQPAFSAETPVALLGKQVHETPPPLSEVEPLVAPYLERAVQKCLEKDPARRFQSSKELEAAPGGSETMQTAGPGETPGAVLPAHLVSWRLSDYFFLCLSLVGTFVFFLFENGILPAKEFQIQIDRNMAIKMAQDYAQRIYGRSEQPEDVALVYAASTTLVNRKSVSYDDLLTMAGREVALSQVNVISPMRWTIQFGPVNSDGLFPFFVALNAHDGSLIVYSLGGQRARKPGSGSLSTDVLRERARQEIQRVYSVDWATLRQEREESGQKEGEWTYLATFVSPDPVHGTKIQYAIRLSEGDPAYLSRALVSADDLGNVRRQRSKPRAWYSASLGLILVALLAVFLLVRRRVLVHWRWALLLSLTLAAAHASQGLTTLVAGAVLVRWILPEFVLYGVIGFLGFSSTLALLAKGFPEKLGPARRAALTGWARAGLGLAIIRGVFLGLALVGLQSAIAEIGLRLKAFWLPAALLGQFADSHFPAFSMMSSAVDISLLLTMIGVALPIALAGALAPRKPTACIGAAALWLALVISGLLLWVDPWSATVFFFAVAGGILGAVLWYFDLATLFFAVFTFEIWLNGYSQVVLFSAIGASGFYAVFALWATLFLYGIWLYFGSQFRRGFRRIAAAFG